MAEVTARTEHQMYQGMGLLGQLIFVISTALDELAPVMLEPLPRGHFPGLDAGLPGER
jgi:hypothetical protein